MTIEEARSVFVMSVDRVKRILEGTPDERLNWSPAPSARTPLAQVAHIANSIRNIHNMMMGVRYETPTREEADAEFLAIEKGVTTRDQALEMLETASDAYVAWLDGLSPDNLEGMVTLPFDLGEAPLGFMLMVPGWHTSDHAAQMEYIQTCYGDRKWNS